MNKNKKLLAYFSQSQESIAFYEKEMMLYNQAVVEYGTKYYPDFSFWLAHISSSYKIIKNGLIYAEYKDINSDRNWTTAINKLVEAGMNYYQNNAK